MVSGKKGRWEKPGIPGMEKKGDIWKICGLAHIAFCRNTKIIRAQETHSKEAKPHDTTWMEPHELDIKTCWSRQNSCTFKVELIVAVINSFL